MLRRRRLKGRRGVRPSAGRGLSVFLSSKIAVALTLFVLVMVIGTGGFMVFVSHRDSQAAEGATPSGDPTGRAGLYEDEGTLTGRLLLSCYMTAITITTVGYDDVVRNYAYGYLDEGWRRAYNAWVTFFVIVAYMVILYVNANFVAYLVGRRLAETMKRRAVLRSISRLSGHLIVCGCGGPGSVVALEALRCGVPVVGIDSPDEPPQELRKRRGFLYLAWDRPDDEMLADAGASEAAYLVSVLGEDSANLYMTLTARLVGPRLRIASRASGADSEEKLLQAGADVAFSPWATTGRRLVAAMLHSETVDFLERMMSDQTHDVRVEEYRVEQGSPVVGRSLRELEIGRKVGVSVFAIMDAGGDTEFNPGAGRRLEAGDVLLYAADSDRHEALVRLMERRKRRWS